MEQELQDLLLKIKGELVKLRNDVLLTQHTVYQIEKKIEKLEKATTEKPDHNLEQIYGSATRIEKL